jgi:hypothetical protein
MTEPEHAQFMELVETARQYCSLIDEMSARADGFSSLIRILPRLHAGIVALRACNNGHVPPEPADFDDRFDLFSQLRVQLGERDTYWLEFDDPALAPVDVEHRSGSLADDLTDIYFELKRGLKMLDRDPGGSDRVAHLWELGFRRHWGQHLVDAERHLYALRVNDQLA